MLLIARINFMQFTASAAYRWRSRHLSH